MTTVTGVIDPLTQFRLDGKLAIVTGASAGLGRRMAEVLDSVGATVVLVARRRERLEQLAERMRQTPIILAADLGDEQQMTASIEAVLAEIGRVDVLVNNAAISNTVPALDERPEDFRRVIEVNVLSPFRLAQLVAPAMAAHGEGSIVNIASIIGLVGMGAVPQTSYVASKGAIISMTRQLASEWAKHGVRVNAIAPGWFPTESSEPVFSDDRARSWVEKRTPLRRGGDPTELDGALLLLASPAGRFMTGQIVVVDGGWTCI